MVEFQELIFLGKLKINMKKILIPKKINKKNFLKYGELISTSSQKYKKINNGNAINYYDLINLDVLEKYGKPKLSLFKVKPRNFPLKIEMLERHPLGSQCFFPLGDCSFIVVVTIPNKIPNINDIKSFIIPPNTGINYKKGVWHYPIISVRKSSFIVIDRKGRNNNLDIYNFKKDQVILSYG